MVSGRPAGVVRAVTDLVDQAAVARYRRDGFVQGGRLLAPEDADALLATVDRIVADPAHPHHAAVFDMGLDGRPLAHLKNVWAVEPAFRDLLDRPELARALHQLTGRRRFRLWQDGFFYKPPLVGSAHGWHQDLVYLPVRAGSRGTAAWVALTDVARPADGAMALVPGSHRWGDATEALADLPAPALDEPLEVVGRGPLPVEYATMERGTVHFHDGLAWHGSVANAGRATRCGLLLFFLDGDDRLWADHPYAERYDEAASERFDDRLHPMIEYAGPILVPSDG